jgi:hypothetical protein
MYSTHIYGELEAFGGDLVGFWIDLRPNASPSRQETNGGDRRESVCGDIWLLYGGGTSGNGGLLHSVRAKHSGGRLSVSLGDRSPNASPLRFG